MPSPISPASYIIHHIDDPNGSTVWVAQNSDRSPLYKRPSPRSACAATVTPFLILSFCRFSSPVLRTRCRDFSLDETLLLLFIGAGCLRARLVAVASARRSTVRSVMHYSWNRNNWNCEWEWEWDGFWTRSRLQSLVWRVALPGYVCRVIGRDPFCHSRRGEATQLSNRLKQGLVSESRANAGFKIRSGRFTGIASISAETSSGA